MSYEMTQSRDVRGKEERTYKNQQGTEVKLNEIYKDKSGTKWFGFADLYNIPVIRTVMARHLTDLYGIGLSLKDILSWCAEEKKLIKSADPEKYEKLYSLVLEKEKLAAFTADPIKQNLALCTVYIVRDGERIDYFDESLAEEKLKEWKAFPEMVGFFLNWHTKRIQDYIKNLSKISATVSKLQEPRKF